MSEDNTLKPCPFCGEVAHINAQLWESVVYCNHCNASGPPKATTRDAVAAWNNRPAPKTPSGEIMSLPEFYAKHRRLIGILEDCAGKEKSAMIVCLETTTAPKVRIHQVKIYGADSELNKDVDELLAYCMTWLDDTKGIKA